MNRRDVATRCGALSLGLMLVVTGCGGSPTSSNGGNQKKGAQGPTEAEQLFDEISALSGSERRDRLVTMAQEEGQFNLYTSMTSEVADAVAEAFTDEFDVEVNLYRAGSETVLQRILQEQRANYAGNDAVETNATEMFAMSQEALLAEYGGERREMVPDAGRFDGWTATRFNLFAPSWNTQLVPEGEQPTSWEDLADPKWDDQISMEFADYDWYLTLYGYWLDQGKSEAEVDQLFADMADGAQIVRGHTVQGELMSAGQFSVTASNYSYLVEQAKRAGAPIEYLPFVEPVIARPNGVALMKAAQNPAAAMLFADWLLEEGQAILVEEGLTPSITEGDDPLVGLEVIPVDVETLIDSGDEWSTRYDEVIAGGEVVEE